MSEQWFSAQELVGIAGMPTAAFSIRRRANREQWKARQKQKGKGMEYHIQSLPEETKHQLLKKIIEKDGEIELAQKNAKAVIVPQPHTLKHKTEAMIAYQSLSIEKQQLAMARSQVLAIRRQYLKPYAENKALTAGEQEFVKAYARKTHKLDDSIYRLVEKVSISTLRRWQQWLDTEGLVRLAGEYKNNIKESKIDAQPDLKNFVVALITGKPQLAKNPKRVATIIQDKSANYPHWDLPSTSSVARWLTQWHKNNGAAFAYLTNPDAYNSKHRPLYSKMYQWVTQPNDCWEFDSTPTDVMLNVNGKQRRYSLIAAIDVKTRRVKVLLSPTSNSEGVCLLLRKCLIEWGMPNPNGQVKTDNGSDYVSDRVTTILDMLEINQAIANPYSGWEKPYIERFFRTLSTTLCELLPGYIGHNVAERQQIEAARDFAQRIGQGKKKADQQALELALTPSQLDDIIQDWVEHHYHLSPHSGLDGISPAQAYIDTQYRPRIIENHHCLDSLLNYIGDATVIRGSISSGNIQYTAPELQDHQWDRKRVRVFLDPKDVGRATLYPIDGWSQYIDAVNIDLVGREIDPNEFREQRKIQRQALNQIRRHTKQLQQEYGIDTHYADTLAAKKAANNLSALPKAATPHNNAALHGLAESQQTEETPAYSEAELKQIEAMRKTLEAKEEQLSEQKNHLHRSIHDKARYLAEQYLTRELTDKEQAFITKYKQENSVGKRNIEEIMARRRQA